MSTVNPAVYFNLAVQLFQRSNPIGDMTARLQEIIEFLLNYKSNIKLNKYRHNLYQQQLSRMEGFLSEGSPYQYRGEKIDRKF